MNDFLRWMVLFSPFKLIALFLVSAAPTLALERLAFDRLQPGLRFSGEGTPQRSFTDGSGSFSQASQNLNFTLPIHRSISRSREEDFSFQQLLLDGTMEVAQPKISSLSRQHSLYKTSLNFTLLSATSGENLYLISAGAGLEEDDRTLSNYALAYYFFGLATFRTGPDFLILLGVDYGRLMGRSAALPIAGFQIEFGQKTAFTFLFPALLQFNTRFAKKWNFNLYIALAGNTSRFSNDGDFPGQSGTLRYRETEYRAGLELTYNVSRPFSLGIEGGTQFARFLTLTADSGDVFSKSIASGFYVSANLTYRFGESWEEKLATLKKHFSLP